MRAEDGYRTDEGSVLDTILASGGGQRCCRHWG